MLVTAPIPAKTDDRDGAALLARCAALDPGLAIHLGTADGGPWVTATELCHDEIALRRPLAAIRRRWSTPDRRVDAMFLAGAYAWYLAVAAVTPYLVGGVAIDLDPANVAFHVDPEGGLDGVAIGSLDLCDPAGGADHVRSSLEDHLTAFIGALRSVTPIGRPALWAVAGDSIASAFLHVGERQGREQEALIASAAVLGVAGSPLLWRGRVVEIAGPNGGARFVERASCCLSYRLEGEDKCDTCPLRSQEDRTARLQVLVHQQGGLTT